MHYILQKSSKVLGIGIYGVFTKSLWKGVCVWGGVKVEIKTGVFIEILILKCYS